MKNNRKLSDEDITEIIRLVLGRYLTKIEVAKKYKVCVDTIYWHTTAGRKERVNEYRKRNPDKIAIIRRKASSKWWKKNKKKAKKKYKERYHSDPIFKRYHNDPIFRKEQLDRRKKLYQKKFK